MKFADAKADQSSTPGTLNDRVLTIATIPMCNKAKQPASFLDLHLAPTLIIYSAMACHFHAQ